MKKLILLILCTALVITSIPACAESETAAVFEDAGDIEASSQLLSAIGVVPGFSADYASDVKRGDFLNALIASLKLGISDNPRENMFYDINSGDAYCSAVNYALELGIISEGQYFRPHDAITYPEAAKMIAVALGYDIDAQTRGGYPMGYVAVADSLDLNFGFNVSVSDKLTVSQCYIMLANMLEADIRTTSSVINTNGELSLRYKEDSNVLTILYNWYPIDGVVSGNSTTHLYDNTESLSENYVIIGSGKYYCTQNPLLGTYVEGYAAKEGNRETVKYLRTNSKSVLTLDASNAPVYQNGKIEYIGKNGKEMKASAENMLAVVYNGKSCVDYTDADFEIKVGRLVLVDSDDNSKYDVIHIYNGEIIVADIVNTDTGKLKDSYSGITVDFSDEDSIRVYEDGILGDTSYITSGAVMEYYPSKNGSYTELNILTNSVSGKYTGKDNENIYIDDAAVVCTPYFAERYLSELAIGADITVVVTSGGMAAAVDGENKSSKKLAYAYKSKLLTGLESGACIKALTQDGAHLELTFADRVKINDGSVIGPQQVYNDYFAGNDGVLFRYSTNADGKIVSLNFADAPASNQGDSVYNPDSDGKDTIKPYVIEGVADTTMVYYKIFGVFVPYFTIDKDTIIFCIDPSTKKTDEERHTIGSTNSWANDSQMAFGTIHPYNVTSSGRANILVIKRAVDTSIDENGATGGVVESVTKAFDAHGEAALKIVLCSGNSYSTLYLEETHESYAAATDVSAGTDIAIGDYILYQKDEYNSIVNYIKHFDHSDGILNHESKGGRDNEVLVYFYGKLGTIESNCLSVDLINASGATKTGKVNLVMQRTYATLVDIPSKTVRNISFGQASNYMDQGHKVLIRTRYADIHELIIYKEK